MQVKHYFSQFGLTMGRFSNPADKLSMIAAEPRKVLRDDITIMDLTRECKEQLKEYSGLSKETKAIVQSSNPYLVSK